MKGLALDMSLENPGAREVHTLFPWVPKGWVTRKILATTLAMYWPCHGRQSTASGPSHSWVGDVAQDECLLAVREGRDRQPWGESGGSREAGAAHGYAGLDAAFVDSPVYFSLSP